jgi:hypothetical protein
MVRSHPYREPSSAGRAEAARPGLDLEEWVVHGLLAIVGVIGIADGLAAQHPTELVLSMFLAFFAGRYLWREGVRPPVRVARGPRPRPRVSPQPTTEVAPR